MTTEEVWPGPHSPPHGPGDPGDPGAWLGVGADPERLEGWCGWDTQRLSPSPPHSHKHRNKPRVGWRWGPVSLRLHPVGPPCSALLQGLTPTTLPAGRPDVAICKDRRCRQPGLQGAELCAHPWGGEGGVRGAPTPPPLGVASSINLNPPTCLQVSVGRGCVHLGDIGLWTLQLHSPNSLNHLSAPRPLLPISTQAPVGTHLYLSAPRPLLHPPTPFSTQAPVGTHPHPSAPRPPLSTQGWVSGHSVMEAERGSGMGSFKEGPPHPCALQTLTFGALRTHNLSSSP